MSAPPKTRSRIIVVDQTYCHQEGMKPTIVETRFARFLKSEEQLFTRRAVAMEQWRPLETGWIEEASLLILANEEGKMQTTIPTKEEQEATSRLILEVAFTPPPVPVETKNRTMWSEPIPRAVEHRADVLVYPGETARFSPADVKGLHIRCRGGNAKYGVTIFPA